MGTTTQHKKLKVAGSEFQTRGSNHKWHQLDDLDWLYAQLQTKTITEVADEIGCNVNSVRYRVVTYFPAEWQINIVRDRKPHIKGNTSPHSLLLKEPETLLNKLYPLSPEPHKKVRPPIRKFKDTYVRPRDPNNHGKRLSSVKYVYKVTLLRPDNTYEYLGTFDKRGEALRAYNAALDKYKGEKPLNLRQRSKYPQLDDLDWVFENLKHRSMSDLAAEIGCPQASVRHIVKAYFPPQWQSRIFRKRYHAVEGVTVSTKKVEVAEVGGKFAGFSMEAIAALMGCSINTASRFLHKIIRKKKISVEMLGELITRYRIATCPALFHMTSLQTTPSYTQIISELSELNELEDFELTNVDSLLKGIES